jgi:phenylacetate-coenzyme A ligase PaaK-like adenylate-forming protein
MDIDAFDDSQRDSINALHAFHDALLPATIRNALETSFFRERWVGYELDHLDRTRLAELPTIDKEEIRAAGEGAQNREGVVCNDVLTSGTTGNPLVTVRSDREQRFIKDFFARQLRESPVRSYLRGLEFTNPYHGHLIGVPGPIHNHRVSVYDAGSFDYGRKTLLRSHNDAHVEERCSVLAGLERCLRAFTLDTISKYPDGFPKTALQLVVSYSQYLTMNWRRRLEETWGAPVVDRFGVSEVFGSASQCLNCGWYHFEPFVIPEVVGNNSGEVLLEGSGLLALTALFPFQQAQPLVRYLTGDLVHVTHESSCRPGTTSVKPLGRARFGVPDPNSDLWLITPASVLEAVDEISEIKRIPRFAGVDQIVDPFAIGHPKYRTHWCNGASRLEVKIELALSSDVTESRRAEILSDVLREVTRHNSRLQFALQEEVVSVVISSCDDVNPDLIAQAHSGGVWSQA